MRNLRQATWTDADGRRWRVYLPDGVPEADAVKGIPIGPPPLESLGLPRAQEVRLHNQLYDRQLFTAQDVKRRRQEVMGAILATFKVDAGRVISLYAD